MDFALARFVNQLGLGTIDRLTEIFCEVPLLLALWSVALVAVLRFDRKNGREIAVRVLIAVVIHFLISEAILKGAALLEQWRFALAPASMQPPGFPSRALWLHGGQGSGSSAVPKEPHPILKHLVLTELPMRVRPYLAHPGEIVPIGHRFEDSSFPSSHAASTAAIVAVLGHAYRHLAGAAAAMVALMAFARVHNGMHYPTDVLAGSVLGALYAGMAIRGAAVLGRRRAPAVTG